MITLYEDEVLKVQTEVESKDMFVHIDIFKKDRKHIEEVLNQLCDCVLSEGVVEIFCMIQHNNKKLKSFATYYGFMKDYDIAETDYEVWVKELS